MIVIRRIFDVALELPPGHRCGRGRRGYFRTNTSTRCPRNRGQSDDRRRR